MNRRWIQSVDVQIDEATGALLTRGTLDGAGKPDLLVWATGSDSYAGPDAGTVTHAGTVLFVRVGSGGALVSVDDEAGQERPYLIPGNYWREIVVPAGIPVGARIVARNLDAGVDFAGLYVEVR